MFVTKDELERIRIDSCEDITEYECNQQRAALLAELDRHMCQCGHWMADHRVAFVFGNACDELSPTANLVCRQACLCTSFKPTTEPEAQR